MSITLASTADIVNLSSEKGSNLTYKNLKIECIVRGMAFREVISGDFWDLSNWLLTNMLKKVDLNLLEQYDNWLDNELLKMGKPELVHNSLRLGYVHREEEDKPKKEKIIKEKKEPRQKDKNGLYQGTKKSYTYDCQGRGKTLEQTIIKVCRKFPDAKAKSIKIWFNKAKKENK
jgi:hypothetical protein